MKYFDSVPKGFFVNSCSVLQLYYDSFLSLVKEGSIDKVFRIDSESPYFVANDIKTDSRSGYFFCIMRDNAIFVTDSLGFTDLETMEESIDNGSFQVIIGLRRQLKENIFSEDLGLVYDWLRGKGYKNGASIKEAFKFFEGDIYLDYGHFLKCKKKAARAGFYVYREVCIAKEAGFINADDLYDAERFRAPNKQSLEAVRILRELKSRYNFDNFSETLIAGVIGYLALKENQLDAEPVFIGIDDITQLHNYWSPKLQVEGFTKVRTREEAVQFLESSKGRMLGHYDASNGQFQFSRARIYIDGANVAFKGLFKGENREELKVPDMQILRDCYQRLLDEGLGRISIYMDGTVVKHIRKYGPDLNREILRELQTLGVLEVSYKGEKADEPLIQKLRDDPFAYVVANDSYEDDYHLTKRDVDHLIQIKFEVDGFEFHGKGYDSLKSWTSTFLRWKDRFALLFYTRELGYWPFSNNWVTYHVGPKSCC